MQRLAANFTAMLAAMAVALIQPGASACRCDAGGSGCCSKPVGPSCCSGKSCQADATSCCCTTGVPAEDAVGCSCSAQAQDAPATAPVGSARTVDGNDGGTLLAPLFAVADLGLHGASWATAFDFEALGGPPGLRLHALLCVWRN